MKQIFVNLKLCTLFKDFSLEEIKKTLGNINYKIVRFLKDETIAIEESKCTSIGIITEGKADINKISASGKILTITRLKKGDIFGEVIVFSHRNNYPATIVATEETEIIFIPKEEIIKLCTENAIFLNNFLGLLSQKILILNEKVTNLSLHTIRQKVANYCNR